MLGPDDSVCLGGFCEIECMFRFEEGSELGENCCPYYKNGIKYK